MYLSRLLLNTRSRAVYRDLSDCVAMHRTLMSAFGEALADKAARSEFGVLYRVDEMPNRQPMVVVQSLQRPDWSSLPEGYVLAEPETKPLLEMVDSLKSGTVARFRLRANPTRKIDTKSDASGRRRHGRRVELATETEQLDWLARKAELSGFEVIAVEVAKDVPDVRSVREPQPRRALGIQHRATPGGGRSENRLVLAAVVFDGHLRITDPERFRMAIEKGVGPGKAYGFGLLSLAAPAALDR